MFFAEDEDDRLINPELYHIGTPEYYGVCSYLENPFPFAVRSVPTHTEDGIPIRKVYVSNLPPKTTRAELFGVFAQYGFIKSCWMRMGEKGPNKSPTPAYAFVTYTNPVDAHKALMAPFHEKILRGRTLRTSPADSWHQPAQDASGQVFWKPVSQHCSKYCPPDNEQASAVASKSTSDQPDTAPQNSDPVPDIPDEPEEEPETEASYDILDILNRDCLTQILSYVPIADLIRSERVSKRWQNMVQEFLQGIRLFKTSWWAAAPATLTTAVLRRLLQRAGGSLVRLHIDHHWSALNDRTAHTLGKFCPNLEELKVVGMHTRNWNPLIYGCKQLRSVSFVSCSKLNDSSLVQLMKVDSCIESLSIATNTNVTGLFLTGCSPPRLNSLSFYNCFSLQPTVICAALYTLENLTTLKLDVCTPAMWRLVPSILKKLPKLEELSLSQYISADGVWPQNDEFSSSLSNLTELRVLNLFQNSYITNAVLKHIAQCHKLESLNVSSCNSRKGYTGVGDEGILAICSSCRVLNHLDVSYLAALTDAGLRDLTKLTQLRHLVARGNSALSAQPIARALAVCHDLQEVDVCGCDSVSEEVAMAAVSALQLRPRPLVLRLASTSAAHAEELPTHKFLTVNIDDDLSNPNLRPDFVDSIENSSDDSFEDIYDHEDFDDFIDGGNILFPNSDDELFMEDDIGFNAIYAYGIPGQDIILL